MTGHILRSVVVITTQYMVGSSHGIFYLQEPHVVNCSICPLTTGLYQNDISIKTIENDIDVN